MNDSLLASIKRLDDRFGLDEFCLLPVVTVDEKTVLVQIAHGGYSAIEEDKVPLPKLPRLTCELSTDRETARRLAYLIQHEPLGGGDASDDGTETANGYNYSNLEELREYPADSNDHLILELIGRLVDLTNAFVPHTQVDAFDKQSSATPAGGDPDHY